MILIADSGSTKTEWGWVEEGKLTRTLTSAGINPYFQTREEIAREIASALSPVPGGRIDAVYFYGAGCAFPEPIENVREAIRSVLPVPTEVHSDLLAAARALCGRRPGIAGILGTGSNACLYDGTHVVDHIPPLGFILGDEGSGAALGKRLVGDCLKRQLPPRITEAFLERFQLTPATILERVYRTPFPNRFLASLSRFVGEHLAEPALYALALDCFRRFFRRDVRPYPDSGRYPVHLVGSIAFHYQEVVSEAARLEGVTLGTIAKAPMEGLVRYHAG